MSDYWGPKSLHRKWLKDQEQVCVACDSRDRFLCTDHIKPRAQGGLDDPSNYQVLCLSCNSRKGNRTIDYRKMSLKNY